MPDSGPARVVKIEDWIYRVMIGDYTLQDFCGNSPAVDCIDAERRASELNTALTAHYAEVERRAGAYDEIISRIFIGGHDIVCSGDPRQPVGLPGNSCSCIGRRERILIASGETYLLPKCEVNLAPQRGAGEEKI